MSYVVNLLGGLSPGAASRAQGINSTGSTVVGLAGDGGGIQRPVYWDAASAIHVLPTLNNGGAGDCDSALGCNSDGTIIVGESDPGVGGLTLAVVWRNGPAWTVTVLPVFLGFPAGGSSRASCCSADGIIIFGYCASASTGIVPCVWNNGVISALPAITLQGEVLGCAPSGVYAVGDIHNSLNNGSATVWSNGALTTLPAPGSSTNGLLPSATGCSSNGGVLVGFGFSTLSFAVLAGYWDVSRSFHQLSSPLGGANSQLFGCDGSGAFMVGIGSAADESHSAAFVWVGGALQQQLPLLAGAASGASQATVISTDATTIAGHGVDASNTATAVKWVWSGPPIPGVGPPTTGAMTAAILNMANVVVTSLTTESPCTVAQYVTPPGVSPAVGLRWSDTRGQTFGNAVAQALGTDPLTQLQWNRTGYARDRVFELFWSAAAKTALNGAFVDVVPWKS